jgi:iron(III) transport system ATP-binding protein
MSEVTIDKVSRLYGVKAAVDELSLTIADGEFVSLLGPSGCGKTTTLAMIAGLDQPTHGRIVIGGKVMADGERGFSILPEARNLGLVPQSYALWPHMRVRDNVGFPLKLRKIARDERERRIEEALALVEIDHLRDRYPHELSGGQQQRVAIARTLAYRPKVLLLDEPLSNLDAKLRERARLWLRQLQRELKMTTIFVTHDQTEALSLSDRIAVLDGGRLAQFGRPEEVYNHPATPFVADFVGGCSFLPARVAQTDGDGRITVRTPEGDELALPASADRFAVGDNVSVVLRPEWLSQASADTPNTISIEATTNEFAGGRYVNFGSIGGQRIRFDTQAPANGVVRLACDVARLVVFRSAVPEIVE